MRIELQHGGLRLREGTVLRVLNGKGAEICARAGSVWITEESEADDVVLEPGGCYRLRRSGLVIVNAPLGDADITVS
jgi:hypothetical protein